MSNKTNAVAKPIDAKVPTVSELSKAYQEGQLTKDAAKDGLLHILNTPPPQSWLKVHPMAKGVKYLPIDRVEFILNNIFKNWRVEVKEVSMIANSVTVIVRVHFQNPITKSWGYEDGVGAAPIPTNKGAGASDWMQVKSDGVQKALPAAKSYAIKDACECIGQIFGTNVNRDREFNYNFVNDHKESFDEIQDTKEKARVLQAIEGAMTAEELDHLTAAAKRHGLLQELTDKGAQLM